MSQVQTAVQTLVPDWPAPERMRALQTLRGGGVSSGPHASLNLGSACGDDPAAVAQNRARLREQAGLPGEPLWLSQVHGTAVVDAAAAPPGAAADASFTTAPGTVCAVQTADCLPVLFCDDDASVVAAAHAGWRGLCAGVLEATVHALPVAPARLLGWLGPAIGPQAFEVGPEVRAAFVAHDPAAATAFRPGRPGRYFGDLYELARQRLAALGVARIFGGTQCTFSDAGRYFSYRREAGGGRMATLIWLEPPGRGR